MGGQQKPRLHELESFVHFRPKVPSLLSSVSLWQLSMHVFVV